MSARHTDTTKGYGALEQDPGQMYTLPGKMNRSRSNVYAIQTSSVPLPLRLTRATGWVDNTKGIYDNGSYQLDLRSRNQGEIILLDKKTGEKLSCSIEGDCC